MMWLPWLRGGLGCGMAAQGGLVTCGSSVPAGMETVREEGVALFDHLCGHKHISSPLLTGSGGSGEKAS